jgi:nucleoside-diphosphate-sugar epimerase
VAAEEVLLDSGYPVTVLRPSKVHGAWSRRPREWVFVKRILDGRAVVVLAERGGGVDHPSAAANIAALIELVAAHPGRRILNSADPDAPSALEISRVVIAHLGHAWREVLIEGTVGDGLLGQTPWSAIPPIVLDTSAAAELGYRPAGNYATTVTHEIDWLVAATRDRAAAWALPADDDPYFSALLDYAAEDRYLATREKLG